MAVQQGFSQTTRNYNVFVYLTYANLDNPITIEIRGSYTPALLQFLGSYCSLWGTGYYSIELAGHPAGLVANIREFMFREEKSKKYDGSCEKSRLDVVSHVSLCLQEKLLERFITSAY